MRTFLLTLTILISMSSSVLAAPSFTDVVTALTEGRDEQALDLCQQLDALGQGSAGLYYNEGLALSHLGRYADSRAAWERVLLLAPRDLKTRRRLREIEAQLGSNVTKLDVKATPWWKQQEADVLCLLPSLGLLLWALRARLKRQRLNMSSTISLGVTSISLIVLLGLSAPPRDRGIIIDPGTALLADPSAAQGGHELAKLPAGTRVAVVDRRQHFVEISLGDGQKGWIRAAQLKELKLPQVQSPPRLAASEVLSVKKD